MSGPRVDEILYELAEAFDGRGLEESNESQALGTNLATVTDAEWRALPPGATRTIESMVLHVAGFKIMYVDYAFGAGTRQWGTPAVEGPWEPGAAPMAAVIDWLREAHRSLVEQVVGLTDDELDRDRMTNWGEMRPTRWILAAMVGHDFYHAGEINHLRSLLGSDDRWRWQQLSEPADA
jgi:uncharacterized damage-inducible protein DinB